MDDSSGVINVRLAEMVVGNLNLRYVDRKTGEVREEGATRPEVVLRQLSTRPGQAGAWSSLISPSSHRFELLPEPLLFKSSLYTLQTGMHKCTSKKQRSSPWRLLIGVYVAVQVYNVRQAKQDIDAVYSMGLFDDVNILPQPSEDSTLEQPKVHPCTYAGASGQYCLLYES